MDGKFNVYGNFNMLKFKRQIQFLSLMGMVAVLVIITPVAAQLPRTKPALISTSQSVASQSKVFSDQQQLHEIPPNQGKPIKVTTGVYINNLVDLDQSSETFEITGYLYSSWRDARLSFNPKEKGVKQLKSYKAGDIWIPKLGLVNSEEFKEVDDYIGVNVDGTVQRVQTFETKLSSKFFLEFFPFDSQKLLILVEPWNYAANQVVLQPDYVSTGISQESYSGLSEWRVKSLTQKVDSVFFPADKARYSRLTVTLQIQRQFSFYLWNVFIPIFFFNIIAWSAFWINPQKFGEQVSVSISSMLFLITFNFIVQAGLPKVPYVTLIDGIIFLSYTFVFISLLSMVMVHYMIEGEKKELALKLQSSSRFFVPLSFVICNLLLFSFLLLTPN